MKKEHCQLAVIGGGLSGLCVAIAAARHGVDTILVQDRPMLGGNCSSEFRMHICGADRHMSRPDARETGILEELLLENKRRNSDFSWPIFDSILLEKARAEERLRLHLNTYMAGVEMVNGRVKAVSCFQTTSEQHFHIEADFFVDATGDGSLSARAGATIRLGREASSEFGESLAPAVADCVTMGSSLMFKAKKLDHKVSFIKPEWAHSYTEEDLRMRSHESVESGYWWIELGGDQLRIIEDAEDIQLELMKVIYGIWDHIKNSPGHDADNLDLEWVSPIAGKRESRRVEGDYILCQSDIDSARIFPDAVAYGGWTMDIHTPGGFSSGDDVPTVWNPVDDVYTIPYRCYYSKDVPNLFLAGRIISASHVAFASARVMATCAVGGQAVGTAAAIALNHQLQSAREVGDHITELQQILLEDDCFIPGFRSTDNRDLARAARISASGWVGDGRPENVVNGIARSWKGEVNAWLADISTRPSLCFNLPEVHELHEIRLTFDSNLSQEITPSIIREVIDRSEYGSPTSLVKDFRLTLSKGGQTVFRKDFQSLGQRHVVIPLDGTAADSVTLMLLSSYGWNKVKVFEVRIH